MTMPSDLPEMQAKQKELQDWRGTLTKSEDETVEQMIEQQGLEHVLSILGHLKNQLEYVRSP